MGRALGPVDPSRAFPAGALLEPALRAAKLAGVTRLADLTRLDRLGFPVWQAVRPLGRALSVHQGKGWTHTDAKLGALLEAVESHAAESFAGEGPTCAWVDLLPSERPPSVYDFAGGELPPAGPCDRLRWAEARHLAAGGRVWVPFDAVSLDFTRGLPSPLDRASNGVATAATHDEAVAVALTELIERDAATELRGAGLLPCAQATLELDSVPFGWFADWRDKLEHAAIIIRVRRAPSVTGTPVFICELVEAGADRGPYNAIVGQGAHDSPELALFRALAEALQTRATFVAGARDDQPPSEYRRLGAGLPFGPPPPPGMREVRWGEIAPGPSGAGALAEALAEAGYPDILVVDLARPEPFHVVRAFACGLGSLVRRRRA